MTTDALNAHCRRQQVDDGDFGIWCKHTKMRCSDKSKRRLCAEQWQATGYTAGATDIGRLWRTSCSQPATDRSSGCRIHSYCVLQLHGWWLCSFLFMASLLDRVLHSAPSYVANRHACSAKRINVSRGREREGRERCRELDVFSQQILPFAWRCQRAITTTMFAFSFSGEKFVRFGGERVNLITFKLPTEKPARSHTPKNSSWNFFRVRCRFGWLSSEKFRLRGFCVKLMPFEAGGNSFRLFLH